MKATILFLMMVICSATCGQEFVIVFLNKRQDKEEMPTSEVTKLMEGHLANISRLAKEGKLWAAGPFDGGGGIFIFRSQSIEEVRNWINTDPAIQAKRWNLELYAYQPRVGSICAVDEKEGMINYHFVRFAADITKYSIGGMAQDMRAHNNYMKLLAAHLDVIAEGSLGEQEGSILILRTQPTRSELENDPAVQKGSMTMEAKSLYIAKGSFCERP